MELLRFRLTFGIAGVYYGVFVLYILNHAANKSVCSFRSGVDCDKLEGPERLFGRHFCW